MTKKYHEVPTNFDSIKDCIIYNKESVIESFFAGSFIFFYDTCSILHHSSSKHRNHIIKFLHKKSATIIITRTVLMELSPNTIHPTQIKYINELYDSGLKILLFEEEFVFDCLKEFMVISNKDANLLLGYAAKEVSKSKTKTYELLHTILPSSFSEKLKGNNPGDKELYANFFKYSRESKEEGDSLAEELILICIIVLSKMSLGRYVFFSDDLRARIKIIDTIKYINKWHSFKDLYQLTTAATVYKMYIDKILTDKEKMIEIMEGAYGKKAPIFFIGEFDIQQVNDELECSKIIDRIINEIEFRVVY